MCKLLPAGQYYFGDPCYTIKESWMDFLKATDFCEDFSNYDKPILAFSTAYGDGLYRGEYGIFSGNYGVDAGLLGFVHVSMLEVPLEDAKHSGIVVDMEAPFEFYAEHGKFYVDGKLIVNTADDDYEEEEEGDYEDYFDED